MTINPITRIIKGLVEIINVIFSRISFCRCSCCQSECSTRKVKSPSPNPTNEDKQE